MFFSYLHTRVVSVYIYVILIGSSGRCRCRQASSPTRSFLSLPPQRAKPSEKQLAYSQTTAHTYRTRARSLARAYTSTIIKEANKDICMAPAAGNRWRKHIEIVSVSAEVEYDMVLRKRTTRRRRRRRGTRRISFSEPIYPLEQGEGVAPRCTRPSRLNRP